MNWAGSRQSSDRAALATLALFAVVLQLAVPQGFMVAAGANGPSIVICTGHGPLIAHVDPGGGAPAPKGKAASICVFAGHGGAPTTPAPLVAVPARFETCTEPAIRLAASTPGRGLAAPPPPSQAPPIRLV